MMEKNSYKRIGNTANYKFFKNAKYVPFIVLFMFLCLLSIAFIGSVNAGRTGSTARDDSGTSYIDLDGDGEIDITITEEEPGDEIEFEVIMYETMTEVIMYETMTEVIMYETTTELPLFGEDTDDDVVDETNDEDTDDEDEDTDEENNNENENDAGQEDENQESDNENNDDEEEVTEDNENVDEEDDSSDTDSVENDEDTEPELDDDLTSEEDNDLDNGIIIIFIEEQQCYLINTDEDPESDTFYNPASGVINSLGKTINGEFLIDNDDDTVWDYICNPSSGEVRIIQKDEEAVTSKADSSQLLPILIMLSIGTFVISALGYWVYNDQRKLSIKEKASKN